MRHRCDRATFPTRILAPILCVEIKKRDWYESNRTEDGPTGGLDAVAHLTGIKPRRLTAILKQETPNVKFETAEKILIGLDYIPGWRSTVSVAEGGLAEHLSDFEGKFADPESDAQRAARERANAVRRNRHQVAA